RQTPAVIQFNEERSHRPETTASTEAKMSASTVVIRPVTRGRFFVRFMTASISRSYHMLYVFAEPAASPPPMTVAMTSQSPLREVSPGHPPAAPINEGTVVMSNSSTMRGFVNARKPAARCFRETGVDLPSGADAADVACK